MSLKEEEENKAGLDWADEEFSDDDDLDDDEEDCEASTPAEKVIDHL